MENKIFVGGLPWAVDNDELRGLFEKFGEIKDVHVVTDRETGRSRGFGFVEFESEDAAKAAIDEMHDSEVGGRKITVNIARPKD